MSVSTRVQGSTRGVCVRALWVCIGAYLCVCWLRIRVSGSSVRVRMHASVGSVSVSLSV